MAIYRVISAHFQGVCGMVRILPHPQVDLGTIYSSSQPHAHVFTIAGLRWFKQNLFIHINHKFNK